MITTTKPDLFREALLRIVKSCRKAMKLAEIFSDYFTEGKTNNVFDDLHGDLEDALYLLNDENTSELAESIVDKVLRDDSLSDDDATDVLLKLILGQRERESQH